MPPNLTNFRIIILKLQKVVVYQVINTINSQCVRYMLNQRQKNYDREITKTIIKKKGKWENSNQHGMALAVVNCTINVSPICLCNPIFNFKNTGNARHHAIETL